MSGTLKTLIHGGMKILLRPPYCTRLMRSWDTPQEGPHMEINDMEYTDSGQQLSDMSYWADEPPLPDVGEMYTETSDDLASSFTCSDAKKLSRRGSVATASFLKPDVSIGRLQAANSIISIVIGLKRLAWAHVDHTMTVRDWQQHEWSQLKGRQHPDLYLEDVASAVSKFPEAGIYILEKSSLSTQNASLFPVTLQLRIVEAMLYVLLNPSYTLEREHRVFSMARTMVGKHFGIMVGACKTSGVDLVQQLVEEANTLDQPRIRFTEDLIMKYKHELHPRGQNRNEEMCDALLQAIAFYQFTKQFT